MYLLIGMRIRIMGNRWPNERQHSQEYQCKKKGYRIKNIVFAEIRFQMFRRNIFSGLFYFFNVTISTRSGRRKTGEEFLFKP